MSARQRGPQGAVNMRYHSCLSDDSLLPQSHSICPSCVGDEANGVLDAFFLGKAIAETVNERLGAALGDALSEITKVNAEAQAAFRSAPDIF